MGKRENRSLCEGFQEWAYCSVLFTRFRPTVLRWWTLRQWGQIVSNLWSRGVGFICIGSAAYNSAVGASGTRTVDPD